MIDYREAVWDGLAAGLGMLWVVITSNPWTMILFLGIIVGAYWLQLAPPRRRRR